MRACSRHADSSPSLSCSVFTSSRLDETISIELHRHRQARVLQTAIFPSAAIASIGLGRADPPAPAVASVKTKAKSTLAPQASARDRAGVLSEAKTLKRIQHPAKTKKIVPLPRLERKPAPALK